MFLPLSVCVKSSEVLVSLVSCTINTESVLNLRTTKTDRVSRCLLHLCHVRLVMSVVLFSVLYVYVLERRSPVRGDGCHRQQYDTCAVVSACAHGFCSVPYSYGFFLQVVAVSTHQNALQNELTMITCSVECTCTFA